MSQMNCSLVEFQNGKISINKSSALYFFDRWLTVPAITQYAWLLYVTNVATSEKASKRPEWNSGMVIDQARKECEMKKEWYLTESIFLE